MRMVSSIMTTFNADTDDYVCMIAALVCKHAGGRATITQDDILVVRGVDVKVSKSPTGDIYITATRPPREGTFDNQAAGRREFWHGGTLVGVMSAVMVKEMNLEGKVHAFGEFPGVPAE